VLDVDDGAVKPHRSRLAGGLAPEGVKVNVDINVVIWLFWFPVSRVQFGGHVKYPVMSLP
jgi:hypothetical protein